MARTMADQDGWDCTRPGRNPIDELHRALRDVERRAELWECIAIQLAERPFSRERTDDREIYRQAAREDWKPWCDAIERATLATLNAAPALQRVGIDPKWYTAIGTLDEIFFKPLFLLNDEQPGDHLRRSAGPLGVNRHGESLFPRERINAARRDLVRAIIAIGPIAQLDADAFAGLLDERSSQAETLAGSEADNAVGGAAPELEANPFPPLADDEVEMLRLLEAHGLRKLSRTRIMQLAEKPGSTLPTSEKAVAKLLTRLHECGYADAPPRLPASITDKGRWFLRQLGALADG